MTISPLQFFSHLKWIDDRPLLDVIEPLGQIGRKRPKPASQPRPERADAVPFDDRLTF